MKIIIILTLIVYVSTASSVSVYSKISTDDEYKCPYFRSQIISISKGLLNPCDDFEKTQNVTEVNLNNLKYSLCGLYYDIFQGTCKLTNETRNNNTIVKMKQEIIIKKEMENINKYLQNINKYKENINISTICKLIGNNLNSSKIHSNSKFSNTKECELFCKQPMSESVWPICQVAAYIAHIVVQLENQPKLPLPGISSPEISIIETGGAKTQPKPEHPVQIVGLDSKVKDPSEEHLLDIKNSLLTQNSTTLRNNSALGKTEHPVSVSSQTEQQSSKINDSISDETAHSAAKKNEVVDSGKDEVFNTQEHEPTSSEKTEHSPSINQKFHKPNKPTTPKPNQHQQTLKQVPSEDHEMVNASGNKPLNQTTSNKPGNISDEKPTFTTVKAVESNGGENPEDSHNDENEPTPPQVKDDSSDKQLPVPNTDTDMEIRDEYAQDLEDQDVEKDKSIVVSKPLNIDEDNLSALYPNQKLNDDDSYFFFYFMVVCIASVLGYVGYHNKQKILAIVLEGRKGRRSQRRRPNSANYHKLDCNLEEAVTSSCNKNSTNVIY